MLHVAQLIRTYRKSVIKSLQNKCCVNVKCRQIYIFTFGIVIRTRKDVGAGED